MDEKTVKVVVTQEAHRAVKIEAAKTGKTMIEVASDAIIAALKDLAFVGRADEK
jgi:hypothetical protein